MRPDELANCCHELLDGRRLGQADHLGGVVAEPRWQEVQGWTGIVDRERLNQIDIGSGT